MATRTRTTKAATVKVSSDVLKKSVTLGDLPEGPQSGGIFHILFPAMSMSSGPSLSPFWSPDRDWQLYQTIFREGQWANAIFKAVSKMASQSFEVDGDVPTRVRKAREMLMQFDAERGWVPGLAKHLQAFLLTGNGAAIEVVHQTGAPGSKVLGLVHLDTFRCLGRDSRVLMADGTYLPIMDLVRAKHPGPVMAIDPSGQVRPRAITGWHETPLGGRGWLRIKLKNANYHYGKQQGLWVTEDHEIATLNGWCRADELSTGQKVMTEHIGLNHEQEELLCGTLLGDGSLTSPYSSHGWAALALAQCEKQEEWLRIKTAALCSFRWRFWIDGRGLYHAETSREPVLVEWRANWYPRGKKSIPREAVAAAFSPRMLATWYLDDGDLQKHAWNGHINGYSVRLATHGFTKDDVVWLANLLGSNGMTALVRRVSARRPDQWTLYLPKASTLRFLELISPFVPECLRYKLPPESPPFQEDLWKIIGPDHFIDAVDAIEEGDNGQQVTAFCIDVEDDHNFFAAGMLVHNCTRTGDPDFPAIYRDAKGREHVMKAHQVILMSDMPDQSEMWYGVGHCAAERAYKAIIRLEAIENYLYEKTTGKRPLAIHIVNGVNEAQLRNAVLLAKQDSSAKGLVTYMGAAIVAMVDPTATPNVATIDLASLPDGFEPIDERKNAYLTYANAIGIDPQLLDPDLLASRALGTGAQSRVISEKQEGIGLSAWRKQFEHQINEHALDEKTTFAFEEVDLDAKRKEADTKAVWATILQTLTMSSVITSAQALQMGVDWEIIPEEFLPQDMTPDTALSDEAKPEGEIPVEQPQLATPVTGVDGVLLDEVLQTVRSAVGSKIAEARKLGREEAARQEAYKALQTACAALAEAETKDMDISVVFSEGLKELAKSLATPAPVIVNIPEHKAAPITFAPVIEQPAIQVQLPLTIEMPAWSEESEVLRDKQGQMVGTRTRRTPARSRA